MFFNKKTIPWKVDSRYLGGEAICLATGVGHRNYALGGAGANTTG